MEAPATLPKIKSITIQGMDSALRHMQENNSYQLEGFILKTVEQEGYLHATALVKHNNVWSWLDSERPERSNITVGLQGRDNLLELQKVAHIAYAPLRSAHLPTTTHTHATLAGALELALPRAMHNVIHPAHITTPTSLAPSALHHWAAPAARSRNISRPVYLHDPYQTELPGPSAFQPSTKCITLTTHNSCDLRTDIQGVA